MLVESDLRIAAANGQPPDEKAVLALESGAVLRFTQETFALNEAERRIVAAGPGTSGAKNISYDPTTKILKGTEAQAETIAAITAMLARFSAFAEALMLAAAPGYQSGMRRGRTSFRPHEIAGRQTSWRKDDKRLHADAFPSTPTGGDRILRVFANVDQAGTPRRWRVGPDFETYAKTFLPKISPPPPGLATFYALTGITKTRRTGYDHLMLGLHDAAKRDLAWQTTAPSQTIDFLPGQVWMVYTDQVPHAALSGRNALEQSFYINRQALRQPAHSPLATLTRLTGRAVVRVLV